MANDKTDQKATVEQRLSSLYKLQTILSEIDRIKQIRGELPMEVKDLEDEIAGLSTRIEKYTQEIVELQNKLQGEKAKIAQADSLIARYKEQLDNVRNNREFDLLTKEVEYQTLR